MNFLKVFSADTDRMVRSSSVQFRARCRTCLRVRRRLLPFSVRQPWPRPGAGGGGGRKSEKGRGGGAAFKARERDLGHRVLWSAATRPRAFFSTLFLTLHGFLFVLPHYPKWEHAEYRRNPSLFFSRDFEAFMILEVTCSKAIWDEL